VSPTTSLEVSIDLSVTVLGVPVKAMYTIFITIIYNKRQDIIMIQKGQEPV
jgi:hypothetical protein